MNATSNPQAAAEQASRSYRASTAQLGFNTSIPERGVDEVRKAKLNDLRLKHATGPVKTSPT
jgi:hypothetical protein